MSENPGQGQPHPEQPIQEPPGTRGKGDDKQNVDPNQPGQSESAPGQEKKDDEA